MKKKRYNLAEFGRWKCKYCGLIFETRAKLNEHIYSTHRPKYGPKGKGMPSWNKGLTKETSKSVAKGVLTLKAGYKSGKIKAAFKGKHHSDKSKKQVSEKMKLAHKEGRANNFAKSRHSCGIEMSYPEKWFISVIKNEFDDLNYIKEFPFFKYSLDFAWVDKKKVIEIDGSLHYDERFPERILHDIERDIYLKNHGWKVLRLRWKYVYKQKKFWIKIAKRFIDDNKDF